MRVGDVRIKGEESTVSIWLPVSKCDQQGFGVRRTLRCCGATMCLDWCPWRLANQLVTESKVKGMFGDAWLFRDFRGATTTKTGVIKKWKKVYGDRTTGHSPRRSGAMFYVRQGLPIQELVFLGRWKSSVVLQYAEETLQEKSGGHPAVHAWHPDDGGPSDTSSDDPDDSSSSQPGHSCSTTP